jgi:hypothetical protein
MKGRLSKGYQAQDSDTTRGSFLVSGSYTVEMALLFPVILFIIVGLIYLGFYMHDQDRLEAVMNETLLKGRNFIHREADMNTGLIDYEAYYNRGILYSLQDNLQGKKQEIHNYLEEQLESRLFIADITSIEIEASHSNLNIEIKGEMMLPFPGIRPLFSKRGTVVTVEQQASIQNSAEFIRIFSIFSGVADKVPVIDETLKKLQQVLNKRNE